MLWEFAQLHLRMPKVIFVVENNLFDFTRQWSDILRSDGQFCKTREISTEFSVPKIIKIGWFLPELLEKIKCGRFLRHSVYKQSLYFGITILIFLGSLQFARTMSDCFTLCLNTVLYIMEPMNDGDDVMPTTTRWTTMMKSFMHSTLNVMKYASFFLVIYLWTVNAKFHYASWFEAGSKLVGDQLQTCLRSASNQLRTS